MIELYAKSPDNGGTTLLEHSYNTGKMCQLMADHIGIEDSLKNNLIILGYLHDIGKATTAFQDVINNVITSERLIETKMAHAYVGWALLHFIKIKINGEIVVDIPLLQNAILNHHAQNTELSKITADEIFDSLTEIDKLNLFFILDEIKISVKKNFGIDFEYEEQHHYNTNNTIPPYWSGNNKKTPLKGKDYVLAVYRFCLLSADRYSSQMEMGGMVLSHEEFLFDKSYIKNKLCFDTLPSFDGFDTVRFLEQREKAIESSKHRTTIIKAAAGFGKTILALLWLETLPSKRAMLVCPFNSIATATYTSIVSDLLLFGFTEVRVGLLLTNEWVHGDIDCDIIITNIDNWLRPSFRNDKAYEAFQLLNGNIIFDEFHEFMSNDALFAAFINIMQSRHRLCNNSKTLLLSATATPLESLWDNMDVENTHIIKCKSHLGTHNKYKFHFVEKVEDIKVTENFCFMWNAVASSQDYYINNTDKFGMVIHSRYTDQDKEKQKNEVWDKHNKFNIKNKGLEINSVVATRIIGTGFDISFSNCAENVLSPQHTVQFVGGRTNRFGEKSDIVNYYVLDKRTGSERAVINLKYDEDLRFKWLDFMKTYTNTKNDNIINLDEFYDMLNRFNTIYKIPIAQHVNKLLTESEIKWKTVKPFEITIKKDKQIKNKKDVPSIRGSNTSIHYTCQLNNTGSYLEDTITTEFTMDSEKDSVQTYSHDFLEKDYNLLGMPKDDNRKKFLSLIENKFAWSDYFGDKSYHQMLRVSYEVLKRIMRNNAKNKKTPFIALNKRYNSTLGCFDIAKFDGDKKERIEKLEKYYSFVGK